MARVNLRKSDRDLCTNYSLSFVLNHSQGPVPRMVLRSHLECKSFGCMDQWPNWKQNQLIKPISFRVALPQLNATNVLLKKHIPPGIGLNFTIVLTAFASLPCFFNETLQKNFQHQRLFKLPLNSLSSWLHSPRSQKVTLVTPCFRCI
jgi:hypothetical protein